MADLSDAALPGGQCIDGVLPAALDAAGLPAERGLYFRELFGLPRARKVCVVMVDGLGFHQLRDRLGHAPNLRRCGVERHISTVVPSTTAAGISSFGTGKRPGLTGMAGYSLRSPHTGNNFSLIAWDEPGLNPQDWQIEPTLFEQLGSQSQRVALIQPAKFVGSGLTMAALRGAPTYSAERLAARVDKTVEVLKGESDFAYLYWGDIDSVGHKHGWKSDRWIEELEHFDLEYGRLLRSLPKGTLVVVTADHGMIDVDERINIADSTNLSRAVASVAGESRAVHLYTNDPAGVKERWKDELGDKAWVLMRDEVISAGLLGKTSARTASVIGDVLAFARDQRVLVDSRFQSDTAIGLIGVHGSLTEAEMHIPLIVEVV